MTAPASTTVYDRPRRTTRFNWLLLTGFWVLMCAAFSARWAFQSSTSALLGGSDDDMRMAVVRDFMNGQGWWDHMQYRLDTPFGAEIPWSRLIDAPIALLIDLFKPFVGGAGAEAMAAYVWPLILLFALLGLSMQLTTRLAGPEGALPGLALPAFSSAIMMEFAPGRIDHHSVQTLFALVLVIGTIEAWQKPRWAIVAGIAGGLGLAIGTEGLPFIVAAVLAFGLYWAVDAEKAPTMRAFGIAFGLSGVAALVIQLPPSRWFVPACDAISLTYAAATVGTSIVLCGLSVLPLAARGWTVRLAAGISAGAVLVALLLAAFPECLGGPYAALDPWLKSVWLDKISEAKPIWQAVADSPAGSLGIVLPPFLALVVIALRVTKGEKEMRAEWMVSGLFLAFAVLVMVIQIRGGRLAATFAVPAGAWLITHARRRYLQSHSLGNALKLVGSWLAFCGIVLTVVVNVALMLAGADVSAFAVPMPTNAVAAGAIPHTEKGCRMPGAFSELAALPAARVMAPVDLGAPILTYTSDSVVGAPYHRAQAGLIDTINFFNRPLDTVRNILAARGITLIVNCPYMPEMKGVFGPDKGSFVDLAQKNALPSWLERISAKDAVLQIYRVAR